MPDPVDIVLHYAPRTRSFSALWLVEELGHDYRLQSFAMASRHHKSPEFMQMNPMGKVPVVVVGETPVSELGAIAIYLADRFPEAKLAPGVEDPQRADFLRWVFFASAIMEPALGEKLLKWQAPASSMAWGSFDEMWRVVNDAMKGGPYLLGETFSAADVLVGSALRFGQIFGALPKEGATAEYVARLSQRDAFVRAAAIEHREGERFPPAG